MKEQFFGQTRRHRRFIVDAMDISGIATTPGEGGPTSFKVMTLSLGGMLIQSCRLHETGSTLQMEMALPQNVRLSFSGSVTSSFPAADGHYDVGIKFGALSEQEKTKLKEFIRWLYLEDAGFDG